MKTQVIVTSAPDRNRDILRRNWLMTDSWEREIPGLFVTRMVMAGDREKYPDRIDRYCALRNQSLDALLYRDADTVVMLDDDIVEFPVGQMKMLVEASHDLKAIAAPSIMLEGMPDFFYDTWGFVSGGRHFTHQPPYLVEQGSMDCVGCLYAMPALPLQSGIRYYTVPGYTDHMGICKEYKGLGYDILWLAGLKATHVNLENHGLKFN